MFSIPRDWASLAHTFDIATGFLKISTLSRSNRLKECGGVHYLQMELMLGEPLAQRVKRDGASAIPPVKQRSFQERPKMLPIMVQGPQVFIAK
jgi:hypothetical protein